MDTYLDECVRHAEKRLATAHEILSMRMREVIALENLLAEQIKLRDERDAREAFKKYLPA